MSSYKNTSIVLFVALSIIFTCIPEEADGQRTMDRQGMVGLEAAASCYNPADIGVQLSYGGYTLDGYWSARLDASPWRVSVPSHDACTMSYGQLTAGGEFLYRILSDRSRSCSLYSGGGCFLGAEGYDMWRHLPSHIAKDYPKSRFLYGICASLELEVFLTGRIAVLFSGEISYTISSLIRPFHPQMKLGIRAAL